MAKDLYMARNHQRLFHFSVCAILLCVLLSGCQSLGFRRINYKWGFIDRTGKMVIAPTFDKVIGVSTNSEAAFSDNAVQNFHDGFSAVAIGDQWGYIDKSGKLVITL